MSWTYLAPAQVFEHLAVQLPAFRRKELMERVRIEIHAEVTRRLARGEGPGAVPVGLLHADIDSWSLPQGILLTGELNPDQLRKQPIRGRIGTGKAPRFWQPEDAAPSGDSWVYPGEAAAGLFKSAVDLVRLRGGLLIEELLAR